MYHCNKHNSMLLVLIHDTIRESDAIHETDSNPFLCHSFHSSRTSNGVRRNSPSSIDFNSFVKGYNRGWAIGFSEKESIPIPPNPIQSNPIVSPPIEKYDELVVVRPNGLHSTYCTPFVPFLRQTRTSVYAARTEL